MEQTDVIIGRIALSSGMITQEQLEEILQHIRAGTLPRAVEEFLLEGGLLTAEQAESLRRVREDLSSKRKEPGLFGRLAVQQGFVTEEQLAEAQRRQQELQDKGEMKPLGAILTEMGLLTAAQADEIMAAQQKKTLSCGVCKKQYQVPLKMAEQARCAACGVKLLSPEEVKQTEAAAADQPDAQRLVDPIGKVVAGCEVIELLGRGSMAAVYRAKHLALGRAVAIKMIPAGDRNRMLVRRLLFEARAIAKLEHANIVQVYDAGLQHGYLFVVMQLVRGDPLEKVLREFGTMIQDQAIGIAKDVLKGLATAHAAGIVHRDLKPANIMITDSGQSKIMDFGLALDMDTVDDVAGLVVGTPYYMAPEQWLGQKADARADLYALGIVLYAMLSGKRPYDGKSIGDLMHQHLKKAALSPKVHNPSLDDRLISIVRKAMSKNALKRYQKAEEFLADIEIYEKGGDPKAMVATQKLVVCGFCEEKNPEGAPKCKTCGEPLHQKSGELTIMPRAGEIRCPKCGEFMRGDARTCGRCATPICRKCRKRVAILQGYCQFCAGQMPPPGRTHRPIRRR